MIRVGLIGAGTVGTAHAESVHHLKQGQIVAIADPNEKQAKELGERIQADVTPEVNPLLERDDVDAVIIANPTPFHFFHARSAIEAGKHVYLEPPVSRELHEAMQLLAIANLSKVIVTVGHTQRFYPEYELIRNRVKEGAVGRPAMVRLGRRTAHPRGWYSNFESSGGVVLDAMIHEFDFLRWTFGPVKRVFCRGLKDRMDTTTLDYALASLRLESGAIAHVESSWCHYGQFGLDVEVAGNNGVLRYDNQDSISVRVSLIDRKSGGRRYFSESPVIKPAYYKTIEQWLDAIEGNAGNPVPLEDGVESLRIAHAALKSLDDKKPVLVADVAA